MPKKSPGKPSNGNLPNPSLTQIQEFYRFMVDQKLETLEYDHQGLHVRLVRQRPQAVPVSVAVPVAGSFSPATTGPSSAAAHATSGASSHAASFAPTAPAIPAGATILKAPMMGIFYRAGTPSSPPFVKTGDSVKKGQVLCLIEAMKVFNEVRADFDCAIVQVLLENGKPVKSGQDLYIVQKP